MTWEEQANCKGLPIDLFFESYENDKSVAEDTDDRCFDCPVRQQCLNRGVETHGTGVFGGVYLVLGKYSKTRNSHKMPYIAEKLHDEVEEIRNNK